MSAALPPVATGRPRRSRLRLAGTFAVAALLVAALWLGYLLWGSNVLAQRSYEQQVAALTQQWQQPAPGVDPARPATAVAPGDAFAVLRIPSLGADYQVPVLSGTALSVLTRGVGHYPATAQPGQVGNFALAGHRLSHGQPFSRLLQLNRGDQVVVETRSAVHTYVLDVAPRDLTVLASASWVLGPVPGAAEGTPATGSLITLTTAQDLVRSPDRSVAIGRLSSTRNKG